MRTVLNTTAAAVLILLTGCANLAPTYTRPEAPVPASWPAAAGSTTNAATTSGATVAADQVGWSDFIADARLREVVALALNNNRDLRVAVLNIEKAHAAYRIEDAARYPTVSAGAGGTRQHQQGATSTQATATVGLSSYELDLFGKAKNLSDAAFQSYLGQQETSRSTRISLIAETSIAWLTLAADAERLKLAQDTLASQRKSYELNQRSHELGAASGLTLAQAQTTVESARVDVATYQNQVQQDRNALALLVGRAVPENLLPASLAAIGTAGQDAASASALAALPAGLPSSVLQRRPDVLAAEHALQAANADIGAARAAYFPSISLTASAGSASAGLAGLFAAGSGAWTFAPAIALPIFDGGSRKAALDEAKVERGIQVATYEKTLQTAFREVADALSVRATVGEQLSAQQALVAANQKSYDLSSALFRNGGASYLDVLTSQRSLYSAQQGAITLRLAEQGNRVTLYKVLGGGA
jgi:multidrug efflux system outer membrane protein